MISGFGMGHTVWVTFGDRVGSGLGLGWFRVESSPEIFQNTKTI